MGQKGPASARASQKQPADDIDDFQPSLILSKPPQAPKRASSDTSVDQDKSAKGSRGGCRASARKNKGSRGDLASDASMGSSFASSADASLAGSARKAPHKPAPRAVDTKVLGKRLSQVAEERAGGAEDLSTTEDESESPQKPTQKPKRGKGTATESIRTLGYAPGSSDEEPEDESEGEAGAPSHKIPGATRQVYHYVRAMPWVCSSASHAMHCIVMFA